MSAAGGWMRALAPAKVNPRLVVLGKRADGYHELDTTLAAVDWCDTVAVRACARPGIELAVAGPAASEDVPRDGRNLVVRAARAALAAAAERGASPAGLEVELEKRVPSQAGLGGGSSDAAAAWLASSAVLGLDDDALARRVLGELGSDCVFFWAARETGRARCRGRGEIVEPLARLQREKWIVIATPVQGASTAAVYRALVPSLSSRKAPRMVPQDPLELELGAARAALVNQLEPAALSAVPELALWRRALDEAHLGHFRLSGSGSSFFGLFDTRAEADRAAQQVLAECAQRSLAARAVRVATLAGHGARLLA